LRPSRAPNGVKTWSDGLEIFQKPQLKSSTLVKPNSISQLQLKFGAILTSFEKIRVSGSPQKVQTLHRSCRAHTWPNETKSAVMGSQCNLLYRFLNTYKTSKVRACYLQANMGLTKSEDGQRKLRLMLGQLYTNSWV